MRIAPSPGAVGRQVGAVWRGRWGTGTSTVTCVGRRQMDGCWLVGWDGALGGGAVA